MDSLENDVVVNGDTGEVQKDEGVDTSKLEKEETSQDAEQQEETEKKGFFAELKEKFWGKEEKKEEDKEDDKKEDKQEEIEEDIPDEFTQAALKAGWTEQDIVEFAGNYDNKRLVALIPYLATEEKKEEKPVKEEKKEEVKKEEYKPPTNMEELIQQVTKVVDAKYQEKFAETEKKLSAYEQERSVKEQQRYIDTANGFFDRAAKDFPVFGKTEELLTFPQGTPNAGQLVPSGPAFEARDAVWKTATAFYKMGESWENSLKEALDWYKGKQMEKEIHQKVIKDLKSNEKRLSPKRTEHKMEKRYANEQEEKVDVILNAARSAGVKGV